MTTRSRTTKLAIALVVAFAVSLVPVAAQAGGAAKAASRGTVTPSTVDRGDTATINGNGFGGPNVKITVGGIAAKVLSATGSKATFRVPATAGPGRVTVRATNPGGKATEAELVIRGDDGSVTIEVDEAATASSSIGEDGGTISVAGMTLSLPAGAVPPGQTITVTPLRALSGSPFTAPVTGLRMEPSGLVLLKPATLTMPRPAGASPAQIATFGFEGAGEEFHLVPHLLTTTTVSILVWHFSGGGTTTATPQEMAEAFGYEPTPAHMRAEQRIAAALADAAINDSDPANAIFNALADWSSSSVRPGLELAASGQLALLELAIGEWQAWRGYLEAYGDNVADFQQAFLTDELERDIHAPLALDAAAAHARTLLGRCTGASGLPLAAIRDVIRLASVVNTVELPIETRPSNNPKPMPTGTELPGACAQVEVASLDHATSFARNRDNRVSGVAQVVFWSGSPSTTIPLRLKVSDTTNGAPVSVDTELVEDGDFDLDASPTANGQRFYRVDAELTAAATDEPLRALSGSEAFDVPVRDRIELEGRRTGDGSFSSTVGPVGAGDTVSIRVRLAGDDVAGRTVALGHSGGGTLPASATTDPQGVATVTYTAPQTTGPDNLTATVTNDVPSSLDTLSLTIVTPVTVTVSPATASLAPGQTRQFTATVTNAANQSVVWSATGGSITQGGLYTAGSTTGPFSVTATSVQDPGRSGSAAVTINQGGRVVVQFRTSQARATGSASVNTSQPPLEDDDNQNFAEGGAAAFGTVSFGAAVSGAVENEAEGRSASFDGSAGHSSTLSGPNPSTLVASGAGNWNGTASSSGQGAESRISVFSSFGLGFQILDAPLTFQVSGSIDTTTDCAGEVSLRNENGALVFPRIASPSGSGSATVTLSPGSYLFTAGGGCNGNGAGDFDFQFSLGA